MIKDNNWNYPNYNKSKEVIKFSDGNKVQKPVKYCEDDLNKNLVGKNLKITLINGREIIGVLTNLGMYDLTIKAKVKQVFIGNISREVEKAIIVLKSAIAIVEVVL